MPEPVTTVGLGAIAAYLGKDGLQKLLGPTAEYLGDGLKNLTQKRGETIGRIFQKASKRLGEDVLASSNHAVPPKVLKHILDDGSFATEDIEIEYLSGILASSRSPDVRDNRGASFASLTSGLSNYQIRCHYVLYSAMKNAFNGSDITPDMNGRPRLSTFISLDAFIASMEFSEGEIGQLDALFPHMLFGLNRNALTEGFIYGQAGDLCGSYPTISEAGVVFQPSAAGIELFLWAFGFGSKGLEFVFSPAFVPFVEDSLLSNIVGSPAKP